MSIDQELEQQAQRLEAQLDRLYAVAVGKAQTEENLDRVAAVWAQMAAICDRLAKTASNLRIVCEDNRALHA